MIVGATYAHNGVMHVMGYSTRHNGYKRLSEDDEQHRPEGR